MSYIDKYNIYKKKNRKSRSIIEGKVEERDKIAEAKVEERDKIAEAKLADDESSDNNELDWKFYLDKYPDLRINGVKTKEQAFSHWATHGKEEGRIPNNRNCQLNSNDIFVNSNDIFVNSDDIIQICHQFGGGTKCYMDFLLSKYIDIKIIDSNIIKINNLFNSKINEMNDDSFTNKTIILHHLLGLGDIINKNIVNIIEKNKSKIKKLIFVVHDYFLLYPKNPNPIKNKDDIIPEQQNIKFAEYFLKLCDVVVFNSNNCYNNFHKYINLNNYNCIITNSVPDILTTNYDIYPSTKKHYNIGVLGKLEYVHKGRDLLKNIANGLKSNYTIKVFGNTCDQFPEGFYPNNIKLLGSYDNINIFKILEKEQIDMFLFVSTFEETYSFTLSIAMQTGLPIIYNDLGSYRERLLGRTNVFSITNSNINDILETIETKSSAVGNILPKEFKIYENNADWNYILYDNINVNFKTELIETQIKHHNICFIHFTNKDRGYESFTKQIELIKKEGLYKKLDFIFITILGTHIKLPNDPKFKVIYYSQNYDEGKYPTQNIINQFLGKINVNCNIIYLNLDNQENNFFILNSNNQTESSFIEKWAKKQKIFHNIDFVSFNENKLMVYPIYFPQFHEIYENNINFYEGYTDINNLMLLKNSCDDDNIEVPDLEFFNIKSICEYDLEKNDQIIDKQISLLNEYNLDGFGMYYYYFTVNTITNTKLIMEKVINKFFEKNLYGKKIFLIWANENWSDNPAFTNSGKHKILNIYDQNSLTENIQLLINFFVQDSYLKINNKPIFFIHHPFLIDNIFLNNFEKNLEKECINKGFNGVYLVLNNLNKDIKQNLTYNMHPNYKINRSIKTKGNGWVLDYHKYISEDISYSDSNIETIFFDFNNTARLYKPDKTHLVTNTINNSDYNQSRMIRKILHTYFTRECVDINNILLVNAWNEWGEKMNIEPSSERKFYYLIKLNRYISFHNSLYNYPRLFNKYILKINNPYKEIDYSLINDKHIDNKLICHIHISNLGVFGEFINYINLIKNKFTIIITYSFGIVTDEISQYIIIKCNNRGMDIGGKLCALDFLYKKSCNYTYILFLHSKSNIEKRIKYFKFIDNNEKINRILELLKQNNNIMAVFNKELLIKYNDYDEQIVWGTKPYITEFLDFMDLPYENSFVEGNCILLKKDILDFIFYENTTIFYNLLNDVNSFDLNWVRYKYQDFKTNPRKLYNMFLNKQIVGQDFASNSKLRDCQIEHLFERIWLNVAKKLNGEWYSI